MKRQNFLLSVLAIAAAPLASFSRTAKRSDRGFKVASGEGRIHGHMTLKSVNSNILDLKVSGSDTDGGFALFEQTSISQGRGTPYHVHFKQDEVFYVLEGSYRFKVGDDLFDVTTGDSIFLPMNVPHAWTQVSEKGKMSVLFQPAGKMEEFFSTLAGFNHAPTKDEMDALFSSCEMKIVGPPLPLK